MLEGARSVTTALSVLARAGVSRTLHVEALAGAAALTVHEGRVLGVGLFGMHTPDAGKPRTGPWTRGVASPSEEVREDFARARWHRRQMERRFAEVLTWPRVRLTQTDAADGPDGAQLGEGIGAHDLILAGLRGAAARVPDEEVVRVLGRGAWMLSRAGEQLVTRAALHPDEEAAVTRLRRPAHLGELREVVAGSSRALRLVWALVQIEAASVPIARGANLSLLLSTSRAARGKAPLVEVRGPEGAQARARVRRLAARLHPDRLGPHAPAGIVAASTCVLGALNRVGDGLRRRT
jgi:hypothetical protein